MIRVKCPKPNCHNHTEVNEIFIGRPVRCIKCGTNFVVKKPVSVSSAVPKPAAPVPLPALLEHPGMDAAPLSELAQPEIESLAVPEFNETEGFETEVTETEYIGDTEYISDLADSFELLPPALDKNTEMDILFVAPFETEPAFSRGSAVVEIERPDNDSQPDDVNHSEAESTETAPPKRGGRKKSEAHSQA